MKDTKKSIKFAGVTFFEPNYNGETNMTLTLCR